MVDSRRYCAYLLRGWRERAEDSGPGAWRFRLRDVQTGEERGFPSLEAITVFLAQEFEREEEDAAPAKEQDERPGQ